MVRVGNGQDLLPNTVFDEYYLSADTYVDFHRADNPINIFSTYDKDLASILEKITLPVFACYGEYDEAVVVPPQESLAILKNKMNKTAPEMCVIDGGSHSYYGCEVDLVEHISDWLNRL